MTTGGQKARLSGTGFLYDRRGSGEKRGSYVDGADTNSDPGSYTTTRRRARTGVLVIPRNGWHTGRRRRGIKLQETGLRISGGLGLKGWRGSQSSGGSSPLQTALVYG
ncbi:hypothetical protein R3P38DRAFT_2782589 [Favolaschia claudopus]|uniref:Uncharacterized protein n=1 Tax=Favolaschia claudopus TaxID=2862362 RepID=A0AAW0B0H7_9AGAR